MRNIITATLLLASLPAFAEPNWIVLSKDSESEYSIDINSVAKQSDGTRRAWFKTNYEKAQPAEAYGKTYYSDLALYAYRCDEGTKALMLLTSFSASNGYGDSVGSTSKDRSKLNYLPPIPGSVGDQALKMACGKKLK